MEKPVAAFVDMGRPDLRHHRLEPLLLRLPFIPSFSLYGEDGVADHPTSVLLAYLEALGGSGPSRCIFESLAPRADAHAWLAAIERLVHRGAQIVTISWGRRSLERDHGWRALEEGLQRLCRRSGVIVVAAAGQPSDGLTEGRRLYLPASLPEVLAADARKRWWGDCAIDASESEILLADGSDPLGGRHGSSFAAPRLAARVTEILCRLRPEQWRPEVVRAVLLAGARPAGGDIPSPGTPETERLQRILETGSLVTRHGHRVSWWRRPAPGPHRLALSWNGGEPPRLFPPLHDRACCVYRGARWLVVDLPAHVGRVQIEGGQVDWGLAWHPLDARDVAVLDSGSHFFDRAS